MLYYMVHGHDIEIPSHEPRLWKGALMYHEPLFFRERGIETERLDAAHFISKVLGMDQEFPVPAAHIQELLIPMRLRKLPVGEDPVKRENDEKHDLRPEARLSISLQLEKP